jgi:hypothetical protein
MLEDKRWEVICLTWLIWLVDDRVTETRYPCSADSAQVNFTCFLERETHTTSSTPVFKRTQFFFIYGGITMYVFFFWGSSNSTCRRGGLLPQAARPPGKLRLRGCCGPATVFCGPMSFNPRSPLDKRQSPQRTRKNMQRCIAVNNRTSRTLLLSPSSGVALLQSPSSSSTALVLTLGADGNAGSDRGRRRKPCPRFVLVHGRARGGRREWGPWSLQDPSTGFCRIGAAGGERDFLVWVRICLTPFLVVQN